MSFLVMVFLTCVCLAEWDWPPLVGASPEAAGLWTLLAVTLVGLHAWWVSVRFAHPVSRDPQLRDDLLPQYEAGRFRHQIVMFGLYGVALAVFGWGWAVREVWRRDGQPLPGVELLTLLPYFASTVVSWFFFYDADRAAHRAAHRLLDADPFATAWTESRSAGPGFGGRLSYVLFQGRQKLALVLIPVFLVVVQRELERLFPAAWREWQVVVNLLGAAVLLVAFLAMPLAIRLLLGLKPLPDGLVRRRLESAARRLRFRCSEILLWNTRNGMANALVVGLVPWLRYVVFTDRLLEEFTEDEVEAVFGHEVGHVRHQHMILYLIFLSLSMIVMGTVAEVYLLPLFNLGGGSVAGWLLGEEAAGELFGARSKAAAIPVVGAVLAYVFVVFGLLSRLCERQADVYGCRAVSCADPLCCGHDAGTVLGERGRALCPTGIRTFIRALDKVALVNGLNREKPGFLQSWQHGTIARRVAFLQRMLRDPAVEPRFQRRLGVFKWGMMAGLVVALAVLLVVQES